MSMELLNLSSKEYNTILESEFYRYIYSSKIDLSNNDIKTNIAILIAADELCLNYLCTFIEDYLLDDESLLKQNFVLIQDVTTKFTQFSKLVQFYKIAIQQDPSFIFKADDFVTIKQEILLSLLVKNNHSEKPIVVWDKLLEWSIARSDELPLDTSNWTHNEVSIFGTIIQPFISYINFKEISPADFVQKVKPFKNAFDLAFLLGNLIIMAKKDDYSALYDFKLLIRGSRDGFEKETFHDFSDMKGPTITIARVKGTDEILGGFHPLNWNSDGVVEEQYAVFNDLKYGPEFGDKKADLKLLYNYKKGQCYKNSYERLIRDDEGEFDIEDYE
ncbi:15961_t:CDS:2, partial [Funneliformis caledonium]